MAIFDDNEVTPKNIVSRQLERIQVPDFSLEENKDTPYAVLADLNAPVYITTNYDLFMEEALRSKGKNPVSEFCVWNKALEESLEIQNFSAGSQGTIQINLILSFIIYMVISIRLCRWY